MLGLAKFLGEVARKLKQPAVLGEMLAGIVLGQTVLGYINPDLLYWLFAIEMQPGLHHPAFEAGPLPLPIAIDAIVVVSACLVLLVAGLEVDLQSAVRQGKATVFISFVSTVVPIGAGFAVAWLFPESLGLTDESIRFKFALFFGVALSITALPVIAKILADIDMAKSDIGVLIVASAMVCAIAGWIAFAVVLALPDGDAPVAKTGGETSADHVWVTIGATIFFLAAMVTVGRLLAHKLLPYIQAYWDWPGSVLVFVLVVALLCAAFTEKLGIHSIFGAFIAGAAIGDSHHLRERTRDTIDQFVTNFFAPLFFASVGLRVNFIDAFDWQMVLIVLAMGLATKIFGSFLGAKIAKLSNRESWAVGFGMVARGELGIIIGQMARTKELDSGAYLISEELFVAIIVMSLVTSLISGPAIIKIFKREKQRRLTDMLNEKQIMPALKGATVREALAEQSEKAAALTGVDQGAILDAVWSREMIASTGLEKGIAVPHARLTTLDKSWVILGRSMRGIDFNAADGRPARIIVMLLTPWDDQSAQIELLSMVAKTFGTEEVRDRFLRAQNATEILAAINLAGDHPNQPGGNGEGN